MNIYNTYYTSQNFINKVEKIYNYRYNYDKVIYKSNYQKVKVICPDHGIFNVTPLGHINGIFCPLCRDVDLVDFTNESTLLDHTETIKSEISPLHIETTNWNQYWNDKLNEIKKDSRPSKPIKSISENGILYILKYQNLYKVGITSKSVKIRFPRSNYKILLELDFGNINYARTIETSILKEYIQYKQKPIQWKGGGNTEFINVSKLEIDNLIEAVSIHYLSCF